MRSDSEDKKSLYKQEPEDQVEVSVPLINNMDSTYNKYISSPFGISPRSRINSQNQPKNNIKHSRNDTLLGTETPQHFIN